MMSVCPKISICVPVYNSEKYLSQFLDSALQQSMDEYEIILADNCSTDHSVDVLRNYSHAFPDKVFVYRTDTHGGPGKARNLAFQRSRGEYIYWCDSDDVLNPRALEKLYREAVQYDADIVCGDAMLVTEEDGEIVSISRYSQKDTMQVSNEIELKAGTEFWYRLFKRSLIEQADPIPEDVILDDVRYVTVLRSYAKIIRHLDFPIYFFIRRINSSSVTSTVTRDYSEDSISASKYTLEYGNPQYLDVIQFCAAKRNIWRLYDRWPFFDLHVKECRDYSSLFYDNKHIKKDYDLLDRIHWIDSLADIQFPNIVYVNGFNSPPTRERLREIREKVFHDGCEIVVLSEETCDVSENAYVKRAYDEGNLQLVTGYFALKKIYENGGIFLHNNIRILNYFSYLKYQNAFFSLIDKNTYSEWIFGAPAGNEAIAAILKTYSDTWDKKGEYMPLSERISIVLTAKYRIPLDGRQRLFEKVVSVIPPDLSVADTRFGNRLKRCAFEHDFSAYANNEEYITLPRSSLRSLIMAPKPYVQASLRERNLEQELTEMKQTNTYKLMMKIRRIGDGPFGPFLKKIFHGLLRIRAKFKRK